MTLNSSKEGSDSKSEDKYDPIAEDSYTYSWPLSVKDRKALNLSVTTTALRRDSGRKNCIYDRAEREH